MPDLKDLVVVITGASSGLGRATAVEAARRGARVVLAARREDALEETARQCRDEGAEALVQPTDVTDEAQVHRLAEAALARFGRLDAWVNNAGITLYAKLEDEAFEGHRRVLEVNLFGAILGARAALPIFRRQHRGVLVNVSSVLGFIGQPFVPAYSISKFAVHGLSENLRGELADEPDIYVCTLCPYALDTPHFESAGNLIGTTPRAIPPMQSPEKTAAALVDLIARPRRLRFVPRYAALGVALHALFPALTEHVLLDALRRWHLSPAITPRTDGNLYEGHPEPATTHGHRPPMVSTLGFFAWCAVRAGTIVAQGARDRLARAGEAR